MLRSGRTARRGGLALAAALLAGAGSAQPQPETTTPGTVLSAPYDIAQCLCLERELAPREADLTARRQAYEALARQIADGQAAIDRQRPQVDVDSQYSVDSFKQLLDQLDALKERQAQVTLPDYQAAVTGYNGWVARYTQRCSGHPLDPAAAEKMRATLVCKPEDPPIAPRPIP
jgi:hypothetical protein